MVRKGTKRKRVADASPTEAQIATDSKKTLNGGSTEHPEPAESTNVCENYLQLQKSLNQKLIDELKQSKGTYGAYIIYNPMEYAFNAHENFAKKFCNSTKTVLFLGMNPGPFGMCQTGIPFGEVPAVRDWLNVTGTINKPAKEAESRPVLGFECKRSEISGKRLWGYFKDLCKEPDIFFKNAFVYNHCPLAFVTKTGKNVTPKEIKGGCVELIKHCDETLSEIVKLLNVKIIVGLGRYAEKQAQDTVKKYHLNGVDVVFLPHPSPRAAGNANWHEKADKCFDELELKQYFQ